MRDYYRLTLYKPVAVALGMISLFILADHFHVSFFFAYIVSLLAITLVISYSVACRILFANNDTPQPRAQQRIPAQLLYAVLFGMCLAATSGYSQQKETLPDYPLAEIEQIDATLRESSVVFAQATKIPVQLERIHIKETILSASGNLDCFLNEQFEAEAHTSISARVALRIQEDARGMATRCVITDIVTYEASTRFVGRVATLRRNIVAHIRSAFQRFPRSTTPMLHALFLGERTSLNPIIAERFRTAGLSHLLALSGMHLAIITVLSGLVFRLLFGVRGARVGSIIFVVIYVWIIGNKPSLNRAMIMLIIWNVMLLFDRRTATINVLAYACIILMIWYPNVRSNLSFQLSFSALAGIVTVTKPLQRGLQKVCPRLLAQPLAMTIAAQSISFALLIYHFGVWYPVGIVSSITITPFITLFMWSALLLLPFYFAPSFFLHTVLNRYMIILYAVTQQGVYWFSQFPAYRF